MLDMKKLMKQIEKTQAPAAAAGGSTAAYIVPMMQVGIDDWLLVISSYMYSKGTRVGLKACFTSEQHSVKQFTGTISAARVVGYLVDCDEVTDMVKMLALLDKVFTIQERATAHCKSFKPKTKQEGVEAAHAVFDIMGGAKTTTIAAKRPAVDL